MVNLLLIGFYELKEHMLSVAEQMEKLNYKVIGYPLFKYAYDSHDKMSNYSDHLLNYINDNDIDVILWWFADVDTSLFENIKKRYANKLIILFNTDDPLNCNDTTKQKTKYIDMLISNAQNCKNMYKNEMNEMNVIYNPIGYDEKAFTKINNNINDEILNKYDCDVSIIINNINVDINSNINIKEMVDNIIKMSKEEKINVNIYGIYLLKELYPHNYINDPPYDDLKYIFNLSKINIVLHKINNMGFYFSQYELQILGCGGLLMTDKIDDSEYNDNHVVFISNDNYLYLIKDILNNYKFYSKMRINGKKFVEKYEISNWAKTLHIEIMKRLFDEKAYKLHYNINNCTNLWNNWLDNYNENRICYKMRIPTNFNIKEYKTHNNIIIDDNEYVYFHWYVNSKNDIFMIDEKQKEYVFSDYNVLPSDIICMNKLMLDIYNNTDYDKNLNIFLDYVEKKPYIKINNIIKQFNDVINK